MKPTDLKSDFKSIVQAHQEKVRNTCFRFVKNPEDADDVAQEVFIQVYESLSRFRNEAELSTWIYRIAVNKSLDFIRRKKRKKRFARLVSIFGHNEGKEEIKLPAAENPQSDLEIKERKRILNWAIDRLPENQRTAITLSKLEGFSNKINDYISNLIVKDNEIILANKEVAKKFTEDYMRMGKISWGCN